MEQLDRKCRNLAEILRTMLASRPTDASDHYELEERLAALEKFWNNYTDCIIELCSYRQVAIDPEVYKNYFKVVAKLRRDAEASKPSKDDFGFGKNTMLRDFKNTKMM